MDDEGRLIRGTDDRVVTLRVRRAWIALALAIATHIATFAIVSQIPDVKPVPKRIELTLRSSPPSTSRPAAPIASPPPAPVERKPRKHTPPPTTSPVLPELPPSDSETAAKLPIVERSPEPSAPPAPSSWKESLQQSLAMTRPKPAPTPTGSLAPSLNTLERVAMADPRLNDEQTERRLMEDFGPFFRRGLEALRGNWHPDEVLNVTERDPQRRCGKKTRTTYAVAIIDKEGDVVDVDLKSESGCNDLDSEAVSAFKRVARFPNPPAGIFVAPDGSPTETARYPVRFIVTFDGGLHLDWTS